MTPRQQIDKLANYIMFEIPGEPSQDQGAVETAIRLLGDRQKMLDACIQAQEALRLTREYVGAKVLPAIPGWSWYDATVALEAIIPAVAQPVGD